MTRETEWALFDGALLHGTRAHARLMADEHRRALYDDLGSEAEPVGPLLLPASGTVVDILRELVGVQRFACAKLISSQPVHIVVEHLRTIRELHAGESAYYFRYADHRALTAVASVLSAEERGALLGPIDAWHYVARDGTVTALRRTLEVENPVALPLQLRPHQWHGVLEAGRIGELYDATERLAQEASPPCRGDDSQRYAWTERAYGLLHRFRIDDVQLRVVANMVIWQSAGRLLEDAVFQYTLREVQGGDSLNRVFDFGRSAPSRT